MAKKVFRTAYNPIPEPRYKPVGKSETIQGQAISVKELIRRVASGNPPNIAKTPFYAEHPNFDVYEETISKLDLVDVKLVLDKMKEDEEKILNKRNELKANELKNLQDKIKDLESKLESELEVNAVVDESTNNT